MIGKLRGVIDSVAGNQLVLDVQGVGYVVQCSAASLRQLGNPGDTAQLSIEMQVREDAINLIGFADEAEKQAFQTLTTVQGVGARVALSILATLSPAQLAAALLQGDKTLLASADGVGPKLAARLATELKDKAGQFNPSPPHASLNKTLTSAPAPANHIGAAGDLAGDAVSALLKLGFRRDEAFAAVMRVRNAQPDSDFKTVIQLSLQELARV